MKTIINRIYNVMSGIKSVELDGMGAGWINLATLGAPIHEAGIDITAYGYDRLRPFLESMPDYFETHVGINKTAKVAYARVKDSKQMNANCNTTVSKEHTENIRKLSAAGSVDLRKGKYLPLENWAYLRDINRFLQKLANMAQKERWDFNNGLPEYPELPILYSYIRYTFCRLQNQNKIYTSIDGDMAAFNTGLTDNRYEPIIALFKKNRPNSESEWLFYDFVIAGEDAGKVINNKFTGSIEPATYTENPSDLIYDINLGAPIVDMDHVVIERVDRLPDSFIAQNAPRGFVVKDTSSMAKHEREIYYENLRSAIRNDSSAYRNMIYRMRDAIALAVKRVHWNYKNAVPMFYPKENRMCLLLPLCLLSDNKEDVALIVKRTPANKYEGATIISLDWAYSDARVVARPNSEWLDANLISGSGETLL